MIIDKDLMVNALEYATDHINPLEYATDHPAMPKETCEMYALRATLENLPVVLALTKAEAAVVLMALQADCTYAETAEEVKIYDNLMEALENALISA